MKRILKSSLDKFYTKTELAKYLISKLDITKYELVIDPCCGDGAFYSNIDIPKIGIDIEPHIENIIKEDFLTWDYSNLNTDREKILIISNPPFGKQGSLAMKFIKKSTEIADTIAFILPLSFSKPSVMNRIPREFHLKYEEILPENSFLLDGEDYSVKCVFQIWGRKYHWKRYIIKNEEPIGFKYTKNKQLAHLSIRRVGVYAGKAFLDTNKSEQSHYFLVLDECCDKINELINQINKENWTDLTVGPRSISKGELTTIINKILNK